MQFRQNGLAQITIQRHQRAVKGAHINHTRAGVDKWQEVVRANIQRYRTDLPAMQREIDESSIQLRANIRILTQKGERATTINHRAAGFTGTAHIGQGTDSILLEISIEVVGIAIIIIEVRLIAKGQRVTQCQIIMLGANQIRARGRKRGGSDSSKQHQRKQESYHEGTSGNRLRRLRNAIEHDCSSCRNDDKLISSTKPIVTCYKPSKTSGT